MNSSKTSEKRTPPVRRMGPAGSPTWYAILDAAGSILRDEGYAALNAKRIAEAAGIKRQLVYYYFQDNDDLFVTLFHHLADGVLERMTAALESDNPLRETWDGGYANDAKIMAEFTALANHSEPLRQAAMDHIVKSREIQVAALVKASKGREMPKIEIPPVAIAILASSVALTLSREAAFGLSAGHQEMHRVIEQFLAQIGSAGRKVKG